MKKIIYVLFLLIAASLVNAEIITKEIKYELDGTLLTGYLAYDNKQKGKRPGVLVVHEWWGHNDYARNRARQLASLGYVAFALDMYGDGKLAEHPKDAGRFAGQVKKNMKLEAARFDAALTQLKNNQFTDAANIAAIGYCFGGGVVLEMARRGKPLKAVVSFHGSLDASKAAQKGEITAKILVFNGADDPFVKEQSITAFRQEMKNAGADFEFVTLIRAKHSFTNPEATAIGKKFGLPLEYNKQADQTSWQQMSVFLNGIFQ